MDIDIEEILKFLEEFSLTADNEVLSKMKELCFVYGCSSEDIVDEWVAFGTRKNTSDSPTIKMLEQLEEELISKKKKQQKSKSVSTPVYKSSTIDLISGNGFGSTEKNSRNQSILEKSPVFSPTSMTQTCFTPSVKYGCRKGAGEVVCSFGATDKVNWNSSDEFSCSINPFSEKTALRKPYHFMSEKLRDRASILNDMIQEAAESFTKKYEIEDWGSLHLPSVEAVSVIGRVCSDSTGKINDSSLLIEGSQEMCSGHTVPLDVSRLEKFSLFPGQIICGSGINSLGKKFIMHSLYENIYPPIEPKVPDLANCVDSLSVVVASGPFATSDTFSYDPLWDLMKYVKLHRPQVLILVGPLIDIKNENIKKGKMNELFSDVFKKLIAEIWKYIEDCSTKVVFVPSTRDAHHSCIYPTPPYSTDHPSKRFYFASDPCLLNIEGVIFSITSTDILFHLGKEEISFPQLPDRLGRLCNHILTQKQLYPLYPCNEEVNIDFLHYELHTALPVIPHVLIVPSDFRYFVKDINGCCCINSERLVKHSSGGTFARLNIVCTDNESYNGSIMDSIRVQVVKI